MVGGIDGCRGGWVVATVPPRGRIEQGEVDVRVVPCLDEVVTALESGRMAAAAIDIPIGLANGAPRACDVEARRMLGPRRSSVFPAPVRAVLGATSYPQACAVSRAACGKALSKQLYNILGKIQEVDTLMSPRLRERLVEACPELSFAVMGGGAPMQHSKRTADGSAERIAVLHEHLGLDIAPLVAVRSVRAQSDDVLDALALAWTARRYLDDSSLRLGGELDATGLRMEVVA